MNAKDVADVVLTRFKTVLIEKDGKVFKVLARRTIALPNRLACKKVKLSYSIYSIDPKYRIGYISDLEKGEKILYEEFYPGRLNKFKIKILEVIE